MAHRIFITGAAGYVGGMLCDLFSQRADVERIVALDKEPAPEPLRTNRKIRWVRANTADDNWQAAVAEERPDIVIHAAWQIRELYGRQALQHRWNVSGAEAVFDFAFGTPSVKRLVHFSSIASYGAQAGNDIAHSFDEEDSFRAGDFRYAEEKRIVEECLARKYAQAHARAGDVAVVVLRPAAIAGPRGRQRQAGLLQSALSGAAKGSLAGRLLSSLVAFVPVTPDWCRQYVHEDDLSDIAAMLALGGLASGYETFNVCPAGEPLRGEDLAAAFRKRAIRVHPQLIRLAFFVLWHGTRGRICTPSGAWKSYSFPLLVSASKLTRMYGVGYRMGSTDAFTRNVGRYAIAEMASHMSRRARTRPAHP